MNGHCLCGAVRFSGGPVSRGVDICHCGMCRRWSSGPLMALHLAGGVTVAEGSPLAWFKSSDHGERGFCTVCGTGLFWRSPGGSNDWAVNAHALETAEGLEVTEHIWVDDKPDFYEFADRAPRLTAADWLARHAAKEPKQ